MTSVGIDGVEIRTGKLELDLAETFAPAQDEDPEKYTEGLGLHASSFPDVYEDIVTMAANAAHRLMVRKGLTPEDIGRIDVATESAFDNSKPVSTYVAGCLEQVYDEDFHHANKGERKFACISGTQSLDDAYNWIRAGRNRGKSALVIATDTALYARDDPGEATQGAGALGRLAGVVSRVEGGVGRDDQRRLAAIPAGANPVVGVVEALGPRDAGELPFALVRVVEILVVDLFETARDVRRDGFRVVESRLRGHVDPADVLGREPLADHQPVGGVGGHRHDVLVDVRERGGVQAEALRVLLGILVLCRRERLREVEFEFARPDLDAVDAHARHAR